MKKTIGIVIFIVGLALGAYGVYVQQENSKILEIGPVEVKSDKQELNWMMIAGGVMAIAGGAILITGGGKKR